MSLKQWLRESNTLRQLKSYLGFSKIKRNDGEYLVLLELHFGVCIFSNQQFSVRHFLYPSPYLLVSPYRDSGSPLLDSPRPPAS
jgi:hypothetical protein